MHGWLLALVLPAMATPSASPAIDASSPPSLVEADAPATIESDPPSADPNPLPPEPEAAPAPTVGELELVWAAMPPEDVLTEARVRIDNRDFLGADTRLDLLTRTTDAAVAWFERGRSLELQERYHEALAAYAKASERVSDPVLQNDVLYRSIITHNDLRNHAEARALARKLLSSPDLSPSAAPIVSLELGVAEVGMGRKRGEKRIARTLPLLEGGASEGAWASSRARFVLTRTVLEEALGYTLEGNKKAARNLVARAGAIKAAEEQVVAIARSGEPEYALAGILALGDAYIALHDDLLAAPPPRSLTEEQANIYRQEIAGRAAVLREKAYRFYDEGVTLAARVQWIGGVTERLTRRRDALAPHSDATESASP